MKALCQIITFCILLVFCAIVNNAQCAKVASSLESKLSSIGISKKEHDDFQLFKSSFNRKYLNDKEEMAKLKAFAKNLKKIHKHNKKFKNGESTYEMGVNKFTDMNDDEFLATHAGFIPDSNSNYDTIETIRLNDPFQIAIPDKFNLEGYNPEVRDQGNCSASWAFAVIGAIEAQIYKETGETLRLSVQHLIDCTKDNFGCNGGTIEAALKFIKENGVAHEVDYPYTGLNNECKSGLTNNGPLFTIDDFKKLQIDNSNDPNLEYRKRSIAIFGVDPLDLRFYKNGTYSLWARNGKFFQKLFLQLI